MANQAEKNARVQAKFDEMYQEGNRNNSLVPLAMSAIQNGWDYYQFVNEAQQRDGICKDAMTEETLERAFNKALENIEEGGTTTDFVNPVGYYRRPPRPKDYIFSAKKLVAQLRKFTDDEPIIKPVKLDISQGGLQHNINNEQAIKDAMAVLFEKESKVWCGSLRQNEQKHATTTDKIYVKRVISWCTTNPQGNGVRDEKNVLSCDYIIIEFDDKFDDEMTLEENLSLQRQFWSVTIKEKLLLPRMIVYSGGKSYHAWICVKGTTTHEFKEKQKKIAALVKQIGADPAMVSLSRLTRTPNAIRVTLDENGRAMLDDDGNVVTEKPQTVMYQDPASKVYTLDELMTQLEKIRDKVTDVEEPPILIYQQDKKGKWSVDAKAVEDFFIREGYKQYISNDDTKKRDIIRIENNIIDTTSESDMSSHIGNHVKKTQPERSISELNKHVTVDKCYFFLPTIKVEPHTDTELETYFYFQNGVLKIEPHKKTMIPYTEIETPIWKKNIIKHDFDVNSNTKGKYKHFVDNITDGINNPARRNSLLELVGYLINRYKHRGRPWAVFISDETDAENSGGSGKGLIWQSIRQVRSGVPIDCSNSHRTDSRFILANVEPHHSVAHANDVHEAFDFKAMFNTITDDMETEKKNKDTIIIPFEKSPKFLFTANAHLKGDTSSYKRRRKIHEITNYYDDEKQPSDEFGIQFFSDDMGEKEWQAFFETMVEAVELYYKSGLKPSEYFGENYHKKRLETEIGTKVKDFIDAHYQDWIDSGGFFNHEIFEKAKKHPYNVGDGKTKLREKIKTYGETTNTYTVGKSERKSYYCNMEERHRTGIWNEVARTIPKEENKTKKSTEEKESAKTEEPTKKHHNER